MIRWIKELYGLYEEKKLLYPSKKTDKVVSLYYSANFNFKNKQLKLKSKLNGIK